MVRTSKTLEQVVNRILELYPTDEDGHRIYTGKNSDVKEHPRKTYKGKQYSFAKLLFAQKYNISIEKVGPLENICHKSLCIEPDHFCQKKDMEESDKNENIFTEMKRKSLLFKLGLLPKSYNTVDCVLFLGEENRDKTQKYENNEEEKNNKGNQDKYENEYGRVRIGKEKVYAHKLSLILKLGRNLLSKMEASHTCRQPRCVNPYHLLEETHTQNVRRQEHCKWSEAQILEIYKLKGQLSQRKIAEKFNMSQMCVWSIHNGTSNSDITGHAKPEHVNRYEFKITPSMLKEIKYYIEKKCDKIKDEVTGEVHMIPRSTNKSKQGYVKTHIYGYDIRFHVLSAIVKSGLDRFPNKEKNEYALHKCRRRDCCAFEHVYIGTKEQNAVDKIRDNTNRNHATIIPKIAELIRQENGTHIEIARKFQTSMGIVKRLRNERTFSNTPSSNEPPRKKQRVI